MKFKLTADLKDFKVNRIIRFLVAADLMLLGGWGLIGPIFAVFILEQIPGGSLLVIGATSAVYWFTKSLIQLPVALKLDRTKGERDDFHLLITSLMLAGFVAMAFLLVESVPGLLFVSFLQGIAFALYTPSWSGIFARHLDKEHYSFEWSLDSTTIGFAYGVMALAGGAIATALGFEAVFVAAALLSFASATLLLTVPNLVLPRKTSNEMLVRDHTPSNITR